MLKQLFILMILFIAITSCNPSFDKKASRKLFNNSHKMFIETEYFGIRTKPITNREYLICLAWHINVFRHSYPKHIKTLLPIGTENIDFQNEEYFHEIYNKSTDLFRKYIMNPKYIDYPVTGLSNQQVQILLKWLNDRYNEDLLIRTDFYNFNMDQMDEDSFVIESLLTGQYLGSVNNEFKSFDNHNFKATFRLPLEEELSILKVPTAIFKPYKFSKKDFLWRWNEAFIRIKDNQIEIRKPYENHIPIVIENNQDIQLPVGKPILLDGKAKTLKHTKFIMIRTVNYDSRNYPYLQKDSLGQMDFLFVGVDKDNRPIAADKTETSDTIVENGIYWIAYNRLLEDEYLPK